MDTVVSNFCEISLEINYTSFSVGLVVGAFWSSRVVFNFKNSNFFFFGFL